MLINGVLTVLFASSCQKSNEITTTTRASSEIVFFANEKSPFLAGVTKATAVTTLSSFYTSAVTGTSGAETAVWTNTVFQGNNTVGYKYTSGGKWWPIEDAGYRFYASNAELAYSAGGATVAATNTKDVVCAYASSPTQQGDNTLEFEHIFARLRNVTVTAASGYTIGTVSIKITPKTGGTYNLRTGAGKTDGTGWSNLTAGSATVISNTTGTRVNDIYLVPGTYTLTASWTIQNDFFYESITDMTVDVDLVAGKTNNISTVLSANIGQVEVSLSPFETEGRALECRIPPPTFAGLQIAPSPLHWNGTTFEIPDDDWNHDSYGAGYGTGENDNDDSYYFTYKELGKFFDSRGENFGETGYPIRTFDNNNQKISYHGYNDWRVPTVDEWANIFGYNPWTKRQGSTVNGSSNGRFKLIQLTGVSHAGTTTPNGVLLFPDGQTITGVDLGTLNVYSSSVSGITAAQLQNYLDQGCAFLPASGAFTEFEIFQYGGVNGYYWSGSVESTYMRYVYFSSSGLNYNTSLSQYSIEYYPARLVRTAE